MMRLEETHEGGLLNSSTQYSSLETTRRMSGFDIPMSTRPKGKWQCYAASMCIVLVAVAAIASACVVTWKKDEQDDSNRGHIQNVPGENISPAPGPQEHTIFGAGHGWARSPQQIPAVEPVASPLPPSFSAIAPAPVSRSSYSASFDLAPYEFICNKTIDRAVCLSLFRSYSNAHKVISLRQSTETAIEAAEHALNESYILAMGMKKKTEGNVALQQCIEVFADALECVNESMSVVAAMEGHSPGSAGADVQSFMSTAMTFHDTCQEGIDEVGPFPGSDLITGTRAKHVDTMLSIALTFVNDLSSPTVGP